MKAQQNLDVILALLFSVCLCRKASKFLQYLPQTSLAVSLYLSGISTVHNIPVTFLCACHMIKKIHGS